MEIEKLGRYEILSELGQGAMGVVYKAVDPLIDRTVAIKTINLNLSNDELADFEERFNREAKSAGRLNHPNIVTIYDVGRADHVAFMAMEYLEGRELKEIIASGEILQPGRAAEIITQVADALAFAHDHGVVHRDIKPANIMVLRNGSVKITDFGIAKMSSGSRTQIGIILGSPKYMSPEQVAGKPVDGRSDIFSLGAVLYELLTGKPAFSGEDSTLTSIMYRVMNEMPASPSDVNPSLPMAFDYIVARALAKAPENRYQSAREMANDLRNFRNLTATSTSTRKKSAAKTGNDGDATVRLNASQIPAGPSQSSGRKWAALAVAAIIISATVLFVTSSRESAVPTVDDNKLATAQTTSAADVTPPPPEETATKPVLPAASESKEPDGQSSMAAPTKVPDEQPSIAVPTQATLGFAVLPWGEIFIDGKSQGASPPLREIRLPPGKHQIEIKNTNLPPYRQTVEMEAGASKTIRHKFK
ncbi:MAG: protein kinase [Gammaproteobacteria bacterium]|nr:protein kinase [Gammaproteobacteria bacterium]